MNRMQTKVGPLHVEQRGEGPALLLWPSLFCDLRTMQPLADGLAADHRVVLVDGPGHGRSGGLTTRYALEDCADAAMEVLDRLSIDRATWIGSAWGGHVGTLAALRHATRLRGLVTMNAPMGAWEGWNRFQNAVLYWTFRVLGRPRRIARTVAEVMIAPQHRLASPHLVDAVVSCILESERAPFVAAVRAAMLDRGSLIPRLPDVRVPTLFIVGDQDELFPVAMAREQASRIRDVRFEVVAGSSHLSAWEAPELVLPLVRRFLLSLDEPARVAP